MRHARRAIAILAGFAAGFIATATVAYAEVTALDPAVAPADPHEMAGFYNSFPGFYNYFPGGEAAIPSTPSTSAAGLPLWQFLAFVALVVLTAVAIVGLGYSLSHSRRSQQPLTH
jgi:hypothetical protein